jgi:hypothetical protein
MIPVKAVVNYGKRINGDNDMGMELSKNAGERYLTGLWRSQLIELMSSKRMTAARNNSIT